MKGNDGLEIEHKTEQFRKQIRKRNRDQLFKVIRNNFLQVQQNDYFKSYQNLEECLALPPVNNNIGFLNRSLITNAEEVDQNSYLKVLAYLKNNFLSYPPRQMCSNNNLNDLIALLGNVLSFNRFRQTIMQQYNLFKIADYLIQLINLSPPKSAELISWVLFQICEKVPHIAATKISDNQIMIKNKIGLQCVYLSELFAELISYKQNTLLPEIIQGYLNVYISRETQQLYIFNLTHIFKIFLKDNPNVKSVDMVLEWIVRNATSSDFPPQTKNSLLSLLLSILHQKMQFSQIIFLLSSQSFINDLLYTGMYDTRQQVKKSAISCLNQVIIQSPILQQRQLVQNFPSVIQMLIAAYYVNDPVINQRCLISTAYIVVAAQNSQQIKEILKNSGIYEQIGTLAQSPIQKISNLARQIILNNQIVTSYSFS